MRVFREYKELIAQSKKKRLVAHVLILNLVIKLTVVGVGTTLIGLMLMILFGISITVENLTYCSVGAILLCLLQLPSDVMNDVNALEKRRENSEDI